MKNKANTNKSYVEYAQNCCFFKKKTIKGSEIEMKKTNANHNKIKIKL